MEIQTVDNTQSNNVIVWDLQSVNVMTEKEFNLNYTGKDASKIIPPDLSISWDDLIEQNKMELIKGDNPTLYAAIYKNTFGTYPKNMAGVDVAISEKYLSQLTGKLSVYNNLSAPDTSIKKEDAFIGFLYKTFDELMEEGKTAELIVYDFTLYAVIYKDTFDKYPDDKGQNIDEFEAARYKKMRNYKRLKELSQMSYDELIKKDLMTELKALSPAAFEAKCMEQDS